MCYTQPSLRYSPSAAIHCSQRDSTCNTSFEAFKRDGLHCDCRSFFNFICSFETVTFENTTHRSYHSKPSAICAMFQSTIYPNAGRILYSHIVLQTLRSLLFTKAKDYTDIHCLEKSCTANASLLPHISCHICHKIIFLSCILNPRYHTADITSSCLLLQT